MKPFSIILLYVPFVMLPMSPIAQPLQSNTPIKGESSEACRFPLGMEHGQIPTSKITASSSFDVKSTGPQNARIRTELVGGAWCPLSTIQEGVKEYLEIDLDINHRITKTETQGRFGNGMGQEYAKNFQLEYWRESVGKWTKYRDNAGNHILDGNTNTYTPVQQILNPPIICSKIRFIPHSVHPMTVCMRVETYGCPYRDGLLYYECAQGYWKNNPDVDLRDLDYDGWVDDSEILRSGLGLLTDSVEGETDFKKEKKSGGNRWMGWSSELDPVKIAFQFEGVRKFTSLTVHVNNLVSEGVEIFNSVEISTSVDGHKFSEFPLRWIPEKGLETDKSHLLTFPLKGRLATLIRLDFFHSNHWLLISEIKFNSEAFTGNVTEEILSLNYLLLDEAQIKPNATNTGVVESDGGESDVGFLGMVIASVGLCLLCCLMLVTFIFLRTNKGKGVSDMGLRPKVLDMHLDNNLHFPKGPKDNLCWTGGDEGESLYNELVFRAFHPPYEPNSFSNPSSSNSTSSSNVTRSTATTSKTNTRQQHQQIPFADYLNPDSSIRFYGRTSSSQPSTPKSERSTFSSDTAPPPPPPKSNRPLPQHLTFNHKNPLFTTPTSASLHPQPQHFVQFPYDQHHQPRPTNYYAATDILRREGSTRKQLTKRF